MNSFIWRKKNITGGGGGNVDTTNLVTTNTNQTISGDKKFSGNVEFANYVVLQNNTTNDTSFALQRVNTKANYLSFYNGGDRQGFLGKASANNTQLTLKAEQGDLVLDCSDTNHSINVSGKKVTNVASPIAGTDCANKQYVDNAISGVGGTTPWTKIGFIDSNVVQPNQTTNPQVIDFNNYELTNGIFSFSLKIGVNNHDLTCSIPNLQITNNNNYSVCSNILTIKSPNDNNKFFDLMIERTTNHQIKLWFYNLKNSSFTISYWGVLIRREGDLITY